MKVFTINLFITFLLIGFAHPQVHPGTTGSPLTNCDAEADIMFLLDASGSILPTDYTKMLQFVAEITKNFNVGPSDVQFGALVFGTNANMTIDLNENSDHASLEQAILSIPQIGGQTYTNKALEMARVEAFTAAHGARPGVPQIAIVLTDGKSSDPSLTAAEVAATKQAGIHIISVGVGTGPDPAELSLLASTPQDMYQVATFQVLDTIKDQLSVTTCQIVETAKTRPSCDAEADILFIVDASASVGSVNYQKALEFMVNITRNFDLSSNQFSTLVFSDDAKIVFDFGDYSNRAELEQKILSSPNPALTTRTDLALQLAREQAFTTAHGARTNVQKMAIVFTDGDSSDAALTQSQAIQLHNTRVKVVSVGITSSPKESELLNIASDPNLMYRVASYAALQTIQNEIANVTCKVASQPLVAQCDAQADIVFLMDSSGSVQQDNYDYMLNFIVNITRNFDVGPTKVQFGAIAFSDNAQTVFDLNTYTDHASLEQAILATPYEAQSTYTGKALDLARTSAFTAANGARNNVPQIVVVFTDGQSTDAADTRTKAAALKATGVKVVSIGIGSSYDKAELELIASSPQDVLEVTGYDVLNTINQQLTNKTCDLVSKDPQCDAQADIVFIMDSSGSVSQANFDNMLNFLVTITRNFDVGTNRVQFGAIVFSDNAQTVFDLNTYTDHASLEQAIMATPYEAQSTYTGKALQLARTSAFTTAHGARDGVPKIAIVLTDGQSTDAVDTRTQANALKAAGVKVVSIGIGSNYDQSELAVIASSQHDVLEVTGYDVLDTINLELTNKTCDLVNNIQCDAQADIVFVMDSSGSVQRDNFDDMLKFLVNITRNFGVGPNRVQFGAVVFSDNANVVFDLNSYSDHASLEQAILSTPYEAQSTYTGKALELVRTHSFSAANGARPNVPQIVVVLTDGQSTSASNTRTQAMALKGTGAQVVSIGIGDSYQLSELQTIASSPNDVFEVTGYDVLHTINEQLTNKTCGFVNGVQCDAQAEVLFVMDASGSVQEANFMNMLKFIVDVTRNFDIGPNNMQFGGIAFSNSAQRVFDFNSYTDHIDLEKAILGTPYAAQTTETGRALALAASEALTTQYGARDDTPRIVVVFTDGKSSNPLDTAVQAQVLRDAGVKVLSVGIGPDVDPRELETIATTPMDVLKVTGYDVLNSINRELTNRTCSLVNQPGLPCDNLIADIMLVMDSSASIETSDYDKLLNFVVDMTRGFKMGDDTVQFGAVVYGDVPEVIFDLDTYHNHTELEQALLSAPYLQESTHTDLALQLLREESFTPRHGSRPGVPQIAIIFTDGQSTDGNKTIEQAELLKKEGVLVFAVGITGQVDPAELNIIASAPQYVFQVANFDVLHSVQMEIANRTCDVQLTTPPPMTTPGLGDRRCYELVDIIFVLDSSGSISRNNYRTLLTFATNLTSNFHLGANEARFGAVIYGTNAINFFNLGDYNDHASLGQTIMAAPHLMTGTNTAGALDLVYQDNMFEAVNGGRDNATKLLIVLTDGQSTSPNHTEISSQRLKDEGIQVVSIGVGDTLNMTELYHIASSPQDVFRAANYDALSTIEEEIANHTCGNIQQLAPRLCSELVDVIFMIESSDAVTEQAYQTELEFAVNITEQFDISPVDARFGALVYGSDVLEVFDLGDYSTHLDLANSLTGVPHLHGEGDMARALNWVKDQGMFAPPSGGRVDAPKVLIVLDDTSTTSPNATQQAANRLKSDGVQIMPIGIEDYNLNELNQLASGVHNAFKVSHFSNLPYLIDQVAASTCDYAKEVEQSLTG